MKNALIGPINRLDTAKGRISKLKHMSIDTLQTEMQNTNIYI